MNIILSTEKDIIKYVEFLSSTGELAGSIGEVVLENDKAEEFLAFKYHTKPSVVVQGITPKLWTTEEDLNLSLCIEANVLPAVIAEEFSRTESSIRSRANKVLNKGFNRSSWYDLQQV